MGKPERFGDLSLDYDAAHERREWIVRRISWWLMAALVAAALGGLLGTGPLSKMHAGERGAPLHIEYERFVRYKSPAELRIYCRTGRAGDFRLEFSRNFFEHAQIEEINPEPKEVITAGDREIYIFAAEGKQEQLVIFRYEPERFGTLKGRVRLDQVAAVEIKQFYWP